MLLSIALFICFSFFDNFRNRELQDFKLCMCTGQIRRSVGTNPCHQWSSADTPHLDVCTNISADHSCEKASLHCLATNACNCPGMASQCRSQSHWGTCASTAASSEPFHECDDGKTLYNHWAKISVGFKQVHTLKKQKRGKITCSFLAQSLVTI